MNFLRPLLLGLLAGSAALCAYAKDDGTDYSLTQEKFVAHYVVNEDGSYVATVDNIVLINEERAISSMAQQTLSYNQSREKIEIVTAYTQKPDGRKVEVKPDQIKDQQEAQSAGAPMFQDMRVKVLIFPEVAVGDRIVYTYRYICSTPMYPGQFEDTTAAVFSPVKQFSLVYDMPASLPLHADNRGFDETAPVLSAGRRIYRWDYVQGENHRIESGTVAYTDYGRRLYVSTFPDYAAMARVYDARAMDKIVVNKKIAALAEKITHGIKDPRARALAIGNWVRKNIRYVAVYIGAGGVVPHSADTILDNLYGDCKDHVTLTEALLKVAGIDSTPALINAESAYKLSSVPVTFNHVITYIPSLDLYMDTTAFAVSPRFLPDQELDKSVLLTHSGKIAHTPLEQDFTLKSDTTYHVSADESADFEQTQTLSGSGAEPTRYNAVNANKTDKEQAVKRTLAARRQNGSGAFEVFPDEANETLKIKTTGHIDNFVDLPGPLGIHLASSFSGSLADAMAGMSSEGARTQDYVCHSRTLDDEARYVVADGIDILAIPRPVSFRTALIDYDARYDKQGQTVIVKRHLAFHHHGAVCTAEEYAAMSADVNKINRDVRGQLILQGKAQ